MSEQVTFRFHCAGFGEDTFAVARFSGEEGISQLYRFQIDLVSEDPDLDVDDILDQPSTFTIRTGHGERVIQGVAADVEVLHQVDELTVYRLVLVPRAWQLTLTQANVVYLDTDAKDVIAQVLDRVDITSEDYAIQTLGDYRAWEFRLQYGESYWSFLSRVLERDGVYYYFESGSDNEKIVFCDSKIDQIDIDSPAIRYTSALGMDPGDFGETVHSLVCRQRRLPRTVNLQNYNDARPSTRINASETIDSRGSGEVNIYGQNVLDQDEADELAKIRADEIYAGKQIYHGESTVCRMSAGYQFELTGHFRTQSNQSYLLTSIEHSGYDARLAGRIGQLPEDGTPAYENRFTAIPSATQYRPPRVTEKPRIHGTLNARIDAAGDGDYAELDEEGRYHIVFPFDTEHEDGKASHWVRMMQPYSGEKEGMHFPLRKKARVLITFLGGDPDLPVISGSIPNAEQPSVTSAENQKKGTIRTPGGNLIETDDAETGTRIKLYSPCRRSYMHLGAQNCGSPGISSGTEGLRRSSGLGGSHSIITTEKALSTLKGDSPDEDSDFKTKGDADVLTIEYQRGLFAFTNMGFPYDRKSNSDNWWQYSTDNGHGGTKLSADSERSGDFMISRILGPAYSYHDGVTYKFQAPGHAQLGFGPGLSLAAADPNGSQTSASDLYKTIFGAIPKDARIFGGSDKPAVLSPSERAQWLKRLPESVADSIPDHSDANRWLRLLSKGRIDVKHLDQFSWHSGNVYDFGGCWNYNLGNGYEENHIDQTAKLNRNWSQQWPKDDNPVGTKVGATFGSAAAQVAAFTAIATVAGTKLKTLTSPTPIRATAAAFIIPAFIFLTQLIASAAQAGANFFQGNVGDVFGGPDEDDTEIKTWAGKVGSSFKDPTKGDSGQDLSSKNGAMNAETASVEKTIGDSYSYRRGHVIEVDQGDTESHVRGATYEYRYGGRKEEHNYNGSGILTSKMTSEAGEKREWSYDPVTGALQGYSYAGKGVFAFDLNCPSMPRFAIEMNYMPLKVAASLNLGMSATVNASMALAAEFNISNGFKMVYDSDVGGKLSYNEQSKKLKMEFAGTEFTKEPPLDLEKKVLELEATVTQLKKSKVRLEKNITKLNKSGVNLEIAQKFNA